MNPSKLVDHPFLSENAVDRVRKLAGSFLEGLQPKLDHALCTWAARDASWVLNRFQLVKAATLYELVYGKSYKGLLAEYGEPGHGYFKGLNKGEARWHLCLFFVKVESQDTCILTDGVQVVLSKRVGRMTKMGSSTWQSTKASNAYSAKYQTNLGGRNIATKRRAEALPVGQTDIPRERVTLKFRDD